MRIGMIGLGRMGANMVRRLIKGGHECVAYDRSADAVKTVAGYGAQGAASLKELVQGLKPPRAVWIMVPAGLVDSVIQELKPLLQSGDVLIDGGNSNYRDDVRRAAALKPSGIHYLDVGTSGGVLGFEQGYCLMIGGDQEAVALLEPVLGCLAPGGRAAGGKGGAATHAAAELGYLHCGASGAGHFVKMVHNGIEYGLMAAYAEGLNLLAHADAGLATAAAADAETAPLTDPHFFQYQFDCRGDHGSVASRQHHFLAAARSDRGGAGSDGKLEKFAGHVADSGEGRWTVQAAIEVGVPARC